MWLKHATTEKFCPYEIETGDILVQYATDERPKPSELIGVYFFDDSYIKALFWLKCIFCGRKKTLAKDSSTAICVHCVSKGRGKKKLKQSEQTRITEIETSFKNTQTKEPLE